VLLTPLIVPGEVLHALGQRAEAAVGHGALQRPRVMRHGRAEEVFGRGVLHIKAGREVVAGLGEEMPDDPPAVSPLFDTP